MDFVTLADHLSTKNIVRHLDQILGEEPEDAAGASSVTINTDQPFLSKSAETELYLLATNFLLYVAMVIITAIVAKIYFPESMERGKVQQVSRSFHYRMAESQANETYFGSDAEDEEDDDDDDDDALSGDDMEVLDSDDEEGLFAPVDLRDEEAVEVVAPLRRPNKKEMRHSNSMEFLEFEQSTMSRAQVLKRLAFCSLMLNITFVVWGVLQERMLTRRYPRHTGDFFVYSYALVFTNRFWTLIMSSALMWYLKPSLSQSTVIYEFSFPSISNMLSSWCQYEALRYVSFPACTLFKSFKLAPVMAMGWILGNKTYPTYDYTVALLIGIGISMFMISSDELKFDSNSWGETDREKWTGVMLLILFLFFDSFTSQFQSRMFQRHRDLSMVELMFATSAFSTVLAGITLIHTKELYPALTFISEHSEIHWHFFLFSCCSTIGQLFIYYTIKNFGAVVFTLIMTIRILLSIALSCFLYGHKVVFVGFLGLMLVIGAVLYRIKRKAEGQQLLKWQGMEDDKAQELVQEWHEHVDM